MSLTKDVIIIVLILVRSETHSNFPWTHRRHMDNPVHHCTSYVAAYIWCSYDTKTYRQDTCLKRTGNISEYGLFTAISC